DRIAMITAEGRLLVFPIAELPELSRGKGNKLIALRGEDKILLWTSLPAGGSLQIESAKRVMTLKPGDWQAYQGARASRGSHLPRGWQTVQALKVETPKT